MRYTLSVNGSCVNGVQDAVDTVQAQYRADYDFLKIHPGLTRAEFMAIARAASDLGIPVAGHVPSDVGVPNALDAGMATIWGRSRSARLPIWCRSIKIR